MQFLASNLTGKPPIFVRGRVTDLGVFKGISTKSWTKLGHMKVGEWVRGGGGD